MEVSSAARSALVLVMPIALLATSGCGPSGGSANLRSQATTPSAPALSPVGAAIAGGASASYKLPALGGTVLVVTNGIGSLGGTLDHAPGQPGQWAFDFDTPSGAPFVVAAARAGKVISEQGDSSVQCSGLNQLANGSPDPGCWAQANYVLVDQGDGTSGLYMHLAPGTITVQPGESVCQGQPLGTDGATGWATARHLHFQVETTPTSQSGPGWWYTVSRAVSFADPSVLQQEPDGVPVQGSGHGYTSANGESGGCLTGQVPVNSLLPPATAVEAPTQASPSTSWVSLPVALSGSIPAFSQLARMTSGPIYVNTDNHHDYRVDVTMKGLCDYIEAWLHNPAGYGLNWPLLPGGPYAGLSPPGFQVNSEIDLGNFDWLAPRPPSGTYYFIVEWGPQGQNSCSWTAVLH